MIIVPVFILFFNFISSHFEPPFTNQMENIVDHFMFTKNFRLVCDKHGLNPLAKDYFYMDTMIAKYTVLVAQFCNYFSTLEIEFRTEIRFRSTIVSLLSQYLYEVGQHQPLNLFVYLVNVKNHTRVACFKFQSMLNRITGEDV